MRERFFLGLALVVLVAALATPAGATPRYAGHYVVKSGDTLSAIALQFKLSAGALARANKLKLTSVLQIGDRLVVPAPRLRKSTPAVVTAQTQASVTTTDALAPAAVRHALDKWSKKEGVPRKLVRALAWIESADRAPAASGTGPGGVMQTMPETRTFVEDVLVRHKLPHTTEGDIEVGVLFLRHLLREFKGNQRLALAAWNEGDFAVHQQGVLPSTKAFVDSVLALAAKS